MDECFPRFRFRCGMKLDAHQSVLASDTSSGIVPRNGLDHARIDLPQALRDLRVPRCFVLGSVYFLRVIEAAKELGCEASASFGRQAQCFIAQHRGVHRHRS
jgi:hypothetical protein